VKLLIETERMIRLDAVAPLLNGRESLSKALLSGIFESLNSYRANRYRSRRRFHRGKIHSRMFCILLGERIHESLRRRLGNVPLRRRSI
jgi:hypothetical protein